MTVGVGRATVRSVDPTRPDEELGSWLPATRSEVDRAVATAAEARRGWARRPAVERAHALSRAADALERDAEAFATLMVREVGKPVLEARAEVTRGVGILRYFAQAALLPDGETYPSSDAVSWLHARRRPVGVCALLTPWNFPLAIPLWKLAPALAYGNAVVLKPAPAATATALRLTELIEAVLPEIVLQLILGGSESGTELVDHPQVAAVSFTGSVAVGRTVAARAAARGARAQCEMGGSNAVIVLDDADLEDTAATLASATMAFAGQKCTATSRIIATPGTYHQLRTRLVDAVESLAVGDPTAEGVSVGPLINAAAAKTALERVAEGGGEILTGGEHATGLPATFLRPTLVELERHEGVLTEQEVFAPVAALIRADSVASAIAMANDSRYGLVAAVHTRELGLAMRAADELEAGLVRVNAPTSGLDYHVPFGGSRDSSFGPREQGLAARDFYTETRTLLVSA